MKRISFALVLCFSLVLSTSTAMADLVAGDISFVAFEAEIDAFQIVVLTDIPSNSTVFFTDNEWFGSSFNNFNEGELTWSTNSLVSAGTVVTFNNTDNASLVGVDVGSVTGGGMNLGQSNEAIFSYIGSSPTATPDAFIAAISDDTFQASGSSSPGTLSGTGLTVGTTAVEFTGDEDGMVYNGPRFGELTFPSYLAIIGDTSNWLSANGSAPNPPLNGTGFTVVSVPEPTAFLFGSLISGVMGLTIARRRRGTAPAE